MFGTRAVETAGSVHSHSLQDDKGTYPCGSNNTIPLCFSHFASPHVSSSVITASGYSLSPEEMKVSMMTCQIAGFTVYPRKIQHPQPT